MKKPDFARCALSAAAIGLLGGCGGSLTPAQRYVAAGSPQAAVTRSAKGIWHTFQIIGYPQGIVRVKNGDFWVADGDLTYTLTRVTPKGKTKSYAIGYVPLEMIEDPQGNLWITVTYNANQIVRVTPSMQVTSFPLTDDAAQGITLGGDGNIWFIENTHIGKLTPAGNLTEYPTGQIAGSSGITWAGGLVWFRRATSLATLNPADGTVKAYNAPNCDCGGAIVPYPDGSLWYLAGTRNVVALIRYDPNTNQYVSYDGPLRFLPYGAPAGMILTEDGSFWYTAQLLHGQGVHRRVVGGGLVRFDPQSKTFTAYAAPKGYSWDWDLVAGPHGTIWATSAFAVNELQP